MPRACWDQAWRAQRLTSRSARALPECLKVRHMKIRVIFIAPLFYCCSVRSGRSATFVSFQERKKQNLGVNSVLSSERFRKRHSLASTSYSKLQRGEKGHVPNVWSILFHISPWLQWKLCRNNREVGESRPVTFWGQRSDGSTAHPIFLHCSKLQRGVRFYEKCCCCRREKTSQPTTLLISASKRKWIWASWVGPEEPLCS